MTKLYTYAQTFAQELRDGLVALRERQDGQTMAEYGVILAVITIAVVLTFVFLGDQIRDVVGQVGDRIDGTSGDDAPPAG